jgi:hypothetical protein
MSELEREPSSRRVQRSPDARDGDDEVSGVHVPTAVVDSIIESTVDPANRFYRYPAARALLPLLGRIPWLTPNHVTYAHIVIGLAAAALVAFTEAKIWLVVAFALCEVRMVLDCFDGVLARAKGSSSPFGRALDEIADTIAFITLICAMTHRLQNGSIGLLVTCLTLTFGGLSANAWDYYKRKITFALRDGKDGVFDELRQKKELIESGKGSLLGYWGVYFDCFQVLLYEVRPKNGDPVSVIRARASDPQFRRFASLLSFVSSDNGLLILHVGVLTGLLFESHLFALGYAVFMWLSTIVFARIVLRSYPTPERSSGARTA